MDKREGGITDGDKRVMREVSEREMEMRGTGGCKCREGAYEKCISVLDEDPGSSGCTAHM